jgi:hypothetical protein
MSTCLYIGKMTKIMSYMSEMDDIVDRQSAMVLTFNNYENEPDPDGPGEIADEAISVKTAGKYCENISKLLIT